MFKVVRETLLSHLGKKSSKAVFFLHREILFFTPAM